MWYLLLSTVNKVCLYAFYFWFMDMNEVHMRWHHAICRGEILMCRTAWERMKKFSLTLICGPNNHVGSVVFIFFSLFTKKGYPFVILFPLNVLLFYVHPRNVFQFIHMYLISNMCCFINCFTSVKQRYCWKNTFVM